MTIKTVKARFRQLRQSVPFVIIKTVKARLWQCKQSRPDCGLGLSHFQCERPQIFSSCCLKEHTRCSLLLLSTQEEMQVLRFGFRISGFGLLVTVADFGFRVLDFGLRASGFGFEFRSRARASSPSPPKKRCRSEFGAIKTIKARLWPNSVQLRQSRPDYGVGFSQFQYERPHKPFSAVRLKRTRAGDSSSSPPKMRCSI